MKTNFTSKNAKAIRTIEEAERARDYYNGTHKSTDNYGCIAWVVQVQVLDKFDKEEFNKYIK